MKEVTLLFTLQLIIGFKDQADTMLASHTDKDSRCVCLWNSVCVSFRPSSCLCPSGRQRWSSPFWGWPPPGPQAGRRLWPQSSSPWIRHTWCREESWLGSLRQRVSCIFQLLVYVTWLRAFKVTFVVLSRVLWLFSLHSMDFSLCQNPEFAMGHYKHDEIFLTGTQIVFCKEIIVMQTTI